MSDGIMSSDDESDEMDQVLRKLALTKTFENQLPSSDSSSITSSSSSSSTVSTPISVTSCKESAEDDKDQESDSLLDNLIANVLLPNPCTHLTGISTQAASQDQTVPSTGPNAQFVYDESPVANPSSELLIKDPNRIESETQGIAISRLKTSFSDEPKRFSRERMEKDFVPAIEHDNADTIIDLEFAETEHLAPGFRVGRKLAPLQSEAPYNCDGDGDDEDLAFDPFEDSDFSHEKLLSGAVVSTPHSSVQQAMDTCIVDSGKQMVNENGIVIHGEIEEQIGNAQNGQISNPPGLLGTISTSSIFANLDSESRHSGGIVHGLFKCEKMESGRRASGDFHIVQAGFTHRVDENPPGTENCVIGDRNVQVSSTFAERDGVTSENRNKSGTEIEFSVPKREVACDEELVTIDNPFCIEERRWEIQPHFYAPPTYEVKETPLVHILTQLNRPMSTRQNIAVHEIFHPPVSFLWKSKFEHFNHLQSEMANVLAYSDDNVVVSAPTGAGKTAIFEMAMARFLSTDSEATRQRFMSKSRKAVYVAPSKALCEERFEDWSQRFSRANLGVEVTMITGDSDPSESFRDVARAHIILTTPEKWDSLTRRWPENFFLFGTVKLFMIDEIHLLADECRGHCLEAIVCRMQSIQRGARNMHVSQFDIDTSSYQNTTPEALSMPLRIVGVSATLPNISDIAVFLKASEAYTFDESYRPVPLKVHVIGQGFEGSTSASLFRFSRSFDRNIPEIIHRFSNKRPSIIFCHSKIETEKLADLLANARGIGMQASTNAEIASQTNITKLQRVLINGIAFHHAGLDLEARRLVERAFCAGKIRALCATSTLAMGVNLPAHLVVIKGTKAWRGKGSGFCNIDYATLLQMIGRAGRPGLDRSGTAVIMTDNNSKAAYQGILSNGLPEARSQLQSKLDDIINSEVSQKVITSKETALNWIKRTFFYIQFIKPPAGVEARLSPEIADARLLKICLNSLENLSRLGVVAMVSGDKVIPLEASHIMCQHIVDARAMQSITCLPFDAKQCQLIRALSEMEGIHFPVRRCEKKTLNQLHRKVKYKLEGPLSKIRIQNPQEKAFVLLQAHIGGIAVDDSALRNEMCSMVEFASRMLVAVEEFSIRGTKNGNIIIQSLKLRRALAMNLWGADDNMLNQLAGVGPTTAFSLRLNGVCTFEDVIGTSGEILETSAKRLPPFGLHLRTAASKILGSTLKPTATAVYATGCIRPSHIECTLTRRKFDSVIPDSDVSLSVNTQEVAYTLVAYTPRVGGCMMYQRNVRKAGHYHVELPKGCRNVTIELIASLVGLDEKVELDLSRDNAVPSHSSALSEGKRKVQDLKFSARKRLLVEASNLTLLGEDSPLKKARNWESSSFVTPSPKSISLSMDRRQHSTVPRAESVTVAAIQKDSASNDYDCRGNLSRVRGPEISQAVPFEENQIQCNSRRTDETSYGRCFSEVRHGQFTLEYVPQETLGRSVFATQRNDVKWKIERSRQQNEQRRAFAQKKDNPFARYKHDPNEAESQLDLLVKSASFEPGGIIPSEGLKMLAAAYSSEAKRPQKRFNSVRGIRPCRPSFPSRVSHHEYISRKAKEASHVYDTLAHSVDNAADLPSHFQSCEEDGRHSRQLSPGTITKSYVWMGVEQRGDSHEQDCRVHSVQYKTPPEYDASEFQAVPFHSLLPRSKYYQSFPSFEYSVGPGQHILRPRQEHNIVRPTDTDSYQVFPPVNQDSENVSRRNRSLSHSEFNGRNPVHHGLQMKPNGSRSINSCTGRWEECTDACKGSGSISDSDEAHFVLEGATHSDIQAAFF